MARCNEYRGKWKIDKHSFLMALHYAYNYDGWKQIYDELQAGLGAKAIGYTDMPKGGSCYDETSEKGEKLAEYGRKIRLIERTAMEAGGDIYPWLLTGVTNENATYNYLRLTKGMPCGHRQYYEKRRKFYYILAQKI